MGRGNWCPPNRDKRESDWVYIYPKLEDYIDQDLSEEEQKLIMEGDMQFEYDLWHEDLIYNIEYFLPKSFKFYHSRKDRRWLDNTTPVIAENGLFDIALGDNESSVAVAMITKEDAPAFADVRCTELANKLFDRMWDTYPNNLYQRAGPWTSGLYIPTYLRGGSLYSLGDYRTYLLEKPGIEPILFQQVHEEQTSVILPIWELKEYTKKEPCHISLLKYNTFDLLKEALL